MAYEATRHATFIRVSAVVEKCFNSFLGRTTGSLPGEMSFTRTRIDRYRSEFMNTGIFPIESYRPPAPDKKLTITDKGIDSLKILLTVVLPGLLLIAGGVLLIRRKRK